MLYHFLRNPPCSFLHMGEWPMRPMDCKNDLYKPGEADYRGYEALVCSGPSGAVGVIRWFQRWRETPARENSLSCFCQRKAFQGVSTRVRWLPTSALDSKCNFSSAISSHSEGGGLIPNSKLFQDTDFVLFCQRDGLHPPWPIQAEETPQPHN